MNDDMAKKLIDQLKMIEIAIPAVNPDPAQTIQAYRDQRAAQQKAADQLVTATEALVRVTARLGAATWVLVTLTVVMAMVQIIELWKGWR